MAGRAPNITPAILRFATVGNLTFATGLVAGGIFFYNRAYSAKFLRDFGLSSGVIDMSPHDAIADGIEGVAAHVLWVVCGLALLVLLTYLCILVVQHFAVRLDRPGSAKPARAGAMGQLGLRIRTDPLFRWLLAATGVTVVTAFLVLLGIVVLGIPAEASADREAAAIKSAVVGRCDEFCSVYQMNGQSVRGFIIGSTPSRLFVWNDACKLSQIKLDDIVTVVPPGREAPSGRARQEPGRES
ncbi:hypothetical protein ASD17_25410 [Sphingomonas sp. Root1294]|nr:hypothetical protein ASD17_25410 [Sphingomonas sp. Root1294]